jgi:transcriptional regulator with XRE-family HTH domain
MAPDPAPDAALVAFGLMLSRARIGAGLSQRELERRTGIGQTRISRLERGQVPAMRAERIARIVVALGLHDRPRRPTRPRSGNRGGQARVG